MGGWNDLSQICRGWWMSAQNSKGASLIPRNNSCTIIQGSNEHFNLFPDTQTSLGFCCRSSAQNAACERTADLWRMSAFQVRNSELIFIEGLYLSSHLPPRRCLFALAVIMMRLAEWYCQCTMSPMQHLKQVSNCYWLTHCPDASVMAIMSVTGYVGELHLSAPAPARKRLKVDWADLI